jgi:amino acid adenylation domain-containing protein
MEKLSTLSPVKQALLEQRLKRASHKRVRRPEIPRRPDRDSAPLSFTQHQMWVIDQMTPGNPAYNLPYGYRLRGRLDSGALEDSFNAVIKRHEALRTTFAIKDGEPLQLIHPELKISLNVTALDHLAGEEREDRLQTLASEESVKSFDLSRLPLIRVSLFKLGEAEHVLIINLHHIVADGLSIGLLLNELDTFYRAFTEGGDPCPPDLAVQYGDFALWQRQTIANEAAYAKQIEFWRTQLGGRLPVLELPGDRPRPARQSFKGSNVFFNISTALVEHVKSLGEREGCTFFMTVLAAFQVLLRRYSGAEDIVIGMPVATRNPGEVEPLIGLILNIAALRCDLAGNPTFIELLRRSRDTTLNVFSNSDLPFEVMLQHVKFERDPSRNPVFQVVLQVLDNTAPRIGDLDISSFHFDLKFAQFDLTLHLYEETGGYQGRFEYCSDLFEAQTIRRLCEHFGTLLEAIVREPDQSISKLPMLTDAERQQLQVDWNQTAVEYPRDSCIHEVYETQARRTPDTIAVEYEGLRLTYGELNARANQVARYLARHGVGPEVMVGVCVERSLEMVVGLLGILKAGGAYVPLDPSYPKERLRFMLEDTQATVLLTQHRLVENLPHHSARVICLDRDWEEIVKESEETPENEVTPENLAYVIYTSGSTGKPKGVEVPHRGILRLLFGVEYVHLDATQTFLHLAPISFDAATFELWGALLHGAQCVLYPGSKIPSPNELGEVLHKHKVSTLWLTSSLFNTVIEEASQALSCVRQLLIGGEAVSVPHVKRALSLLPNTDIINCYGPTESTTFACTYAIPRLLENKITNIPIGKPIGNTSVYILDNHLQPVPIGVIGEVHIGGDGLARGYLNRPELTAEKFIANPFSDDRRAKLYKTGDLARYFSDGNIEFVGRIDKQVKIRGFRVEPGEINAVLNTYPSIRDSHVLARRRKSGELSLCAYYVADHTAGNIPTDSELRSFLRERLPNYMVPGSLIRVETIPLTPNGKVDHQGLPDPESDATETGREFVEPRDETERALCRIWAETFGLDRVGIDDDFFAIGGHSLLAAKLFSRLDEQFGRSLPLGVLFSAPTVRALAERYRTVPERQFRALVALRKSGSLTPVFAVPGVYGNVLGFTELSQALGPDQPFYGLQSVGLDGSEAPLTSIEEMAKLNISELRTVQPLGPYAIIGACFGATVAYEMARQLLAEGIDIAYLGLLDPTQREGRDLRDSPALTCRTLRRAAALGNLVSGRLHLYLEEMIQLNGKDRINFVAQKLRSLGVSVKQSKRLGGARRELNQIDVYRSNLHALDRYQRNPLNGKLKFLEIFETSRCNRAATNEAIDWAAFWKDSVMRHLVPGKDSGDMLSGHNASVLAALLAERLREAFRHSSDQPDFKDNG